jgi:CMP/dCMP kinase
MTKIEIIAMDGPASSGKSTVAAILAHQLGFLYFDTGVMYRAVTLGALQKGVAISDEAAVTQIAETAVIEVEPPSKQDGRQYDVLLDGEDVTWGIRSREVEGNVSPVSTYAGVRTAMTAQQRRIGLKGKVVMVGRDIGTVVLPEAPLKIYLDASVEERARRRHLELTNRGEKVEFEAILNNLRSRDQIDSTRKVAPLKIAPDAKYILSDGLSIDQVVEQIRKFL